jgi:hypothetical protein
MVTTRTEIRAVGGEHICTASMTLAKIPGNSAAAGHRMRKSAAPPALTG